MAEKENKLLKNIPLIISIVTLLVSFSGSWAIVKYRIDSMDAAIVKALDMVEKGDIKVEEKVIDKIENIEKQYYRELRDQKKINEIQMERLDTIEKALLRKGLL